MDGTTERNLLPYWLTAPGMLATLAFVALPLVLMLRRRRLASPVLRTSRWAAGVLVPRPRLPPL